MTPKMKMKTIELASSPVPELDTTTPRPTIHAAISSRYLAQAEASAGRLSRFFATGSVPRAAAVTSSHRPCLAPGEQALGPYDQHDHEDGERHRDLPQRSDLGRDDVLDQAHGYPAD